MGDDQCISTLCLSNGKVCGNPRSQEYKAVCSQDRECKSNYCAKSSTYDILYNHEKICTNDYPH